MVMIGLNVRYQVSVYHHLNTNWIHKEVGMCYSALKQNMSSLII